MMFINFNLHLEVGINKIWLLKWAIERCIKEWVLYKCSVSIIYVRTYLLKPNLWNTRLLGDIKENLTNGRSFAHTEYSCVHTEDFRAHVENAQRRFC